MDLTNFIFFKDTPLIDFQNTIHFRSNEERDNFFLHGNHYQMLNTEGLRFNYIRDRSTIDVPIPYRDFRGVNYCTFLSEFEPNKRYYAYVINYEYINDNNVRVYLLIDAIMTHTQGTILENLSNLSVTRRHLTKSEYHDRLWELKNNDDVIKTSSKYYFNELRYNFYDFDIIIQCTCDLEADFGTVDDPKIETSEGLTYDKLSSPVNLYHVKQDHFQTLMKLLAPYPWITQNFRSINMIPSIFINDDALEPANLNEISFNFLSKFKNNGSSNKRDFENDIQYWNNDMEQLYARYGLKENEKHLLRNEYATTEIYTWDGQQLLVDMGLLNEDTGIEFKAEVVTGFHNEIAVYLNNYKMKNVLSGEQNGSFLNDAIYFRNFDEIPILIDNYTLALSKSANVRALQESKLVSNRIRNVMNPNSSLQDRFYNAANLISNVSPMNLFGRFSDEYDFYQQQKAEQKDLALGDNTITNQSTDNALKRSGDFYGIAIKESKPTDKEMEKVKKYYQLFGFELNDENSSVKVETHTICNYVQFSGSWRLLNMDVGLLEQMKAQFENGVRFWHNNNTSNPMQQNVLNNTWRD